MSRYTCIGAGALGTLFAARLSLAGFSVQLLVRRAEQARLIDERGLSLREGHGAELTARPVVLTLEEQAGEDGGRPPAGTAADELHYILLSVKQTAITEELARSIKRLMGPGSWVVCLQNGIGHAEKLARYIPRDRLLLAVTTEASLRVADNAAIHTGRGETYMGAYVEDHPGENSRKAQKNLILDLKTAGFEVFLSNEIINRAWQKLIINAAINPLSAILQIRNGLLLERSEARELMRLIVEEGVRLAEACGISLGPNPWMRVQEVCSLTTANQSSMLQDRLAGRPTEIEAIAGSMLEQAEAMGMELHVLKSVYLLVKALESRE
ncbi:2-dehydropantoate 2-reductase [Paenibacillus sp. UNCCL117]|uniref:ketopantoate reductase family protein n=1 Tax=unclassified Paenibacillus TaxID=185978 RepID=UPI00088AC3A1|nr:MULTISPECIES: 2-dehydropantoate 2-reductase [unclassified Paenibacillus]SDC73530.1 2-dehydropantoate 2-reductase [Paenibacillus sp. cl123]SFW25032.1 2-dehydropantoate 2-reductase [Paenibacillus sp. UNCCL117]